MKPDALQQDKLFPHSAEYGCVEETPITSRGSGAFVDRLPNLMNESIDGIAFATDQSRVALCVENVDGRTVSDFITAIGARGFDLVGDAIALCDEPTSALDPALRGMCWP